MKITRRQLRRIVETASGRRAARASLNRKNRVNAVGSEMAEYEDWLQDKYGPYLDELQVGWSDGESRDPKGWMVLDEIEGRWVHSGVTEKGPIGQMKAWDYINGADVIKHKASQKAAAMMESRQLSKIRKLIREQIESEYYKDLKRRTTDKGNLVGKSKQYAKILIEQMETFIDGLPSNYSNAREKSLVGLYELKIAAEDKISRVKREKQE